jgi:hypothetical protein
MLYDFKSYERLSLLQPLYSKHLTLVSVRAIAQDNLLYVAGSLLSMAH